MFYTGTEKGWSQNSTCTLNLRMKSMISYRKMTSKFFVLTNQHRSLRLVIEFCIQHLMF